MKKLGIVGSILVGAMAVVSSVQAGEISVGERIIGLEVAAAKIQADTYGPTGEYDHTGDDVEYGLRLGAQNKEWRTLLVVDYFDSSNDDQQYVKGLVTFDYLIMQESAFKPFIGVNLGYISYSTSNPVTGDGDDSGFLYGGQAGFLYRLAENIQMDVSYRYSFSEANSVNHTEGIVFGINYIF